MRIHNQKRNTFGRRFTALLLLCGLLLPAVPQTSAATVTYEYNWIKDATGLPTDDQWHDYFLAWEDLDNKKKVWFTDYHWYTPDGDNNIDEGGSSWMEYKAASTLPDSTSGSFTSKDSLGHMQIKYAGTDADNGNAPKYLIRVSKMNGTYSYFTAYEPTSNEKDAQAFTFEDHGDVFHIFVNRSGIDRYLTRDGQYLETTYSSSSGGSESYRHMRVYKRSFTVDASVEEAEIGEVIGKTTLYEYYWVNTAEEIQELANGSSEWQDVILAWHGGYKEGDQVRDEAGLWYTKEVWEENDTPSYKNDYDDGRFSYWSNQQLGDGYTSGVTETFVLPEPLGHFQMKLVGKDSSNPVKGAKIDGRSISSPKFQFRFSISSRQQLYLGKYDFTENSSDARGYTIQLFLEGNYKGYSHIFQNITAGEDEYLARNGNRMALQEHNNSDDWQYYFRVYACRAVEYDAIVKSFTIGKGATYSIGEHLILNEGVTITVEDGGVLMVDKELLNNGHIIINKGGTVIVNTDGYIMTYNQNADGKITIDGGNMIIMDNGKVVCDVGDGALRVSNGATIVNRGVLMVGKVLELRNSSYLKNESTGMLLAGGTINRERGNLRELTAEQMRDRVTNGAFTLLCSTKSILLNKGIISAPKNADLTLNSDDGYGFKDLGQTNKR